MLQRRKGYQEQRKSFYQSYHAHHRCAGIVTGDIVGEEKPTTCPLRKRPGQVQQMLQHIWERDSEAMDSPTSVHAGLRGVLFVFEISWYGV